MANLVERLGHPPDAKLLIVTCDDLGLCHAANMGVYDALHHGLATSASLMVPCPWARGAAAQYRGEDVGVHLTLNAELDLYRWGPITLAPSLLDGDGGFPRTVEDMWDHADLDEVRRECRAQIERAILWGFDVSHLDAHLSALELRPEFFDVYVELAAEFRLPIRLSGASNEAVAGFPFRRLAAEAGVVFPDELVVTPMGGRTDLVEAVGRIGPGVTEVYLHPAVDSSELRALAADWQERVDDHALLAGDDEELRDAVSSAGITMVGYRALRDLMRA